MITDKHFIDWEAAVFGYGYGTGEAHTLPALKTFLELCGKQPHFKDASNYNYEELEKAITPLGAWLMITILAHADIVEYGTSPRFGWLTEKGALIKAYTDGKTAEQLYEVVTSRDEETIVCMPDYCNCDPATPCNNPLFKK